MKKFVLIIIVAITTIYHATAQFNVNTNSYWKGEMLMEDGSIKSGYIQVPNIAAEKKIAFKASENGKSESIKKEEIESIKVVSENGRQYIFDNVKTGSAKSDKSTKKFLLFVQAKNNYATFYIMSQYKTNDNEGKIYVADSYVQGKDLPSFSYYLKKRGSPKANFFYITGQLGGLKTYAEANFSEDPALLSKIKKKELGPKDIPEIIETYLKTTEDM